MPQYKRVGLDFTADMDNPNPEFWELVEETTSEPSAPTEAPEAESEESE